MYSNMLANIEGGAAEETALAGWYVHIKQHTYAKLHDVLYSTWCMVCDTQLL
jgi:hypothetical protein